MKQTTFTLDGKSFDNPLTRVQAHNGLQFTSCFKDLTTPIAKIAGKYVIFPRMDHFATIYLLILLEF